MSLNTTPRTWVAGEVVTAAEMNAEVRDALTGIQAAWGTYSPAWTAVTTNPTIGNGTLTGRFIRYGKTVLGLQIVTTIGSTTTIGSGGYRWSLPVVPNVNTHNPIGVGNFSHSGDLARIAILTASGTVLLNDMAGASVGSATPAAPVATDIIVVSGSYEAA